MEQENLDGGKLIPRVEAKISVPDLHNLSLRWAQVMASSWPLARNPLPWDTVIIGKLGARLEKPADPPYALWIQAPFESGTETSSRSAAIRFVQMLIEARALFISCICWRPNKSEIPNFEGTEGEAGILAMVYSLILQLLKFKPPGREQIELNENDITTLDGNITHWKTALGIFATLLKGTPKSPLLQYF